MRGGRWVRAGVRRAAEWVAGTWRLCVEGEAVVEQLRAAGVPIVFAVWHGAMLPPLWHRRGEGIALLVGRHRDAQLLAEAALRWGYAVYRGSSTRGGAPALKAVVRALRSGVDVALTPDGPRGPPRVAKRGVVAAARLGGARIVPVRTRAESAWRLGSWDRMAVPRPFSCVGVEYGPPIDPLEPEALAALTAALDRWPEGAACA